ncbi:MAG: DUF2806 domain-containing protein [Candidatus Marinimicrobia bacterium]|nr:DUF2806 domain-containing protein [Candidatus Neomarinimicrobiota bacterium]
MKANLNIEITEIEQRDLVRHIHEEGKKQENVEKITADALGQLQDHPKPENINNDWITNFFDKCRLISESEMQSLWSRLKTGEANKPGSYSKNTISIISNLEKSDAQYIYKFAYIRVANWECSTTDL